MTQRTFEDPVLELAMRLGDGPEDVIGLASEMTDADAERELDKLDWRGAKQTADGILATLRGQGHTL